MQQLISVNVRLAILWVLLGSLGPSLSAQEVFIRGKVVNEEGRVLPQVQVAVKELDRFVLTGQDGFFSLKLPQDGAYTLGVFSATYQPLLLELKIDKDTTLTCALAPVSYELAAVQLEAEGERGFGIHKLGSIEGVAIYEAKKTEVVELSEVTANLATNNARQALAKVAGLNIWESDAAGLQLGIGGRGLSPNRTSNFNTRQNGYDISADALGYPESYYTPPLEALDRVEVIRGAASLQYGTQFGGMVNFVMKEGQGIGKPIAIQSRQTVGSFGLFSSYNSLKGETGDFHYLAFFQHKQGNGWRPNEGFDAQTGYAALHYQPTDKLELKLEYTGMQYLAQQAGGLTDRLFELNPRQSIRSRNWFQVNWNLLSTSIDYAFSPETRFNLRVFGNLSGRDALGNLARITRFDTVGMPRTLIQDDYQNLGAEARLIHEYRFAGQQWAILLGGRAYRGLTQQRQGEGSTSAAPDFFYQRGDQAKLLLDYRYPSANYAAFVEHIFRLGKKISLTPGVRLEHIRTFAEGEFRQQSFDAAGNLVSELITPESNQRIRSLILFGVGLSYQPSGNVELYGNFSQNYRAVTFNDLRVVNPNFQVDPDIQDERGYNADLGLRGNLKGIFYFDVSFYHLFYRDRIGLLLRADQAPLFLDYRFRTNVADSRTFGLELVGELEWIRLLTGKSGKLDLSTFVNLALNHARYVNTQDPSLVNRKVELVPEVMVRGGVNLAYQGFRLAWQHSYVGSQYTDATNAERTASAVNGLIPAYQVMDLSAGYVWRWLSLDAGVNNLLDAHYFTRRATGYPGPGIIPSPGRNVYLTLGVEW